MTSSPSSRNVRVSPTAAPSPFPPSVISSRLPKPSAVGAEMVPEPNRSPAAGCSRCCCDARRAARRSSTCAACCQATADAAAAPCSRRPRRQQQHLQLDVERPLALVGLVAAGTAAAPDRPSGRRGCAIRNGASASGVTTHGEMRGGEVLGQERARAAGTPTPGCRAPTSR